MTKKEEAQLKREEKLLAERARIRQMQEFERTLLEEAAYKGIAQFLVCGVDEAGRGPFAGPVVAGAVILDLDDPEKEILYLNDSKKLSEKKREMLYREILQKAVAVGVGYADSRMIDEINILQATYAAMRMAIENLQNVSPIYEPEAPAHELVRRLIALELSVDLDGLHMNVNSQENMDPNLRNQAIPDESVSGGAFIPVIPDFILADAVTIPEIDIPQQGIIKGDAKSVSIAAGSIIAKVTRDHIMYEYDQMYPAYGFASHKGYGTAAHIAAIREHGMTDIHRRSFIHLS